MSRAEKDDYTVRDTRYAGQGGGVTVCATCKTLVNLYSGRPNPWYCIHCEKKLTSCSEVSPNVAREPSKSEMDRSMVRHRKNKIAENKRKIDELLAENASLAAQD